MAGIEALVLGLGNTLMRDDGAGVRAVERLVRAYRLPDGVRAVDGGTLGLALLPWLREADVALLVDAVRVEAPPGTLVRREGEAVSRAVLCRLSPHQVGVADLLFASDLLGGRPRRVVLLGVVPERIELGLEPSPAVAVALPALVAAVVAELEDLGLSPVAAAA